MNAKFRYPTIKEEQFYRLMAENNGNSFLIVFTADWLGEGTIMDTIVRQLSEEYQEEVDFYRIDVDKSKKIATQMGIRRLPTIFFFQQGEIVDQVVGMKSSHQLRKIIENLQ